MQQPFVDTMPNAASGEAGDERQGGRRRSRRGGRGRDRDDAPRADGNSQGELADGEALQGDAPRSEAAPANADTGAAQATAIDGEGLPIGHAGGSEGGEPNGAAEVRGDGASGSRRRGRGGRGRDRDRGPRDGEANGVDEVAAGDIGHVGEQEERPDDNRGEPMESMAASAPVQPMEPTALVESDVPAEDEPVAAVQRTEPAAAAPAAPTAANYALPMDSLVAVAESAGLQWVNSDADKIRSAHAAMADAPPPIRVPREIRRVTPVEEGALVMVETKKDLSQVKLPFEQDSAKR